MLHIHQKIEQARISAGLTQDEMAEKLGIKRSTYQYWEKKTPAIDKIKLIADALKLPEDYFFGNKDENFIEENRVVNNPTGAENKVTIDSLAKTLELSAQARLIDAESRKVEAKNIERMITLLELKFGVIEDDGGLLPKIGEGGAVDIREKSKKNQPKK